MIYFDNIVACIYMTTMQVLIQQKLHAWEFWIIKSSMQLFCKKRIFHLCMLFITVHAHMDKPHVVFQIIITISWWTNDEMMDPPTYQCPTHLQANFTDDEQPESEMLTQHFYNTPILPCHNAHVIPVSIIYHNTYML